MFNPAAKKETTKHDSIHETTSGCFYIMLSGRLFIPQVSAGRLQRDTHQVRGTVGPDGCIYLLLI